MLKTELQILMFNFGYISGFHLEQIIFLYIYTVYGSVRM